MVAELTIQVVDETADPRRVDALRAQLERDLRGIGSLSVRPAPATPAPNSKSGLAETIGQLLVSGVLSATTLAAIRDVVVAYLDRTAARSVTIRDGEREVTITAASIKDLARVRREFDALTGAEDGTEARG